MSGSKPIEPEGDLVSATPAHKPFPTILRSSLPSTHVQSVSLVPLSESHSKDLYPILGGPASAHLYRYMSIGPFYDFETFHENNIKHLMYSGICCPFAIFKNSESNSSPSAPTPEDVKGSPIGIITLMNPSPTHRSIEIGAVLFSPLLQRTTAATEAIYLLMKHCFETLGYRRVEWKANDLNEPSKRAAVRVGFVPEGVFRKHMIIKGRNRDTAWFSVVDDEWTGGVKQALELWLEKGNFNESGKQVRNLEDIRRNLVRKETKGP